MVGNLPESAKKSYTVGFLGPQGTYSHEAALNLFGSAVNLQAYASIDAAIRAVAAGEIPECVAPIENSLEGSVNVTLDTLAHEVELFITREIVMPVRHNLLARGPGRSLRLILSHPQALAQCRRTLSRLYPGAEVRAIESTAEAARQVAGGVEGMAAVGGRAAAEIYGLDILAADIQDTSNNCTRFVTLNVLGAIGAVAGRWKTSVVIQIDGSRPGALYAILAEFATRGCESDQDRIATGPHWVGRLPVLPGSGGKRRRSECESRVGRRGGAKSLVQIVRVLSGSGVGPVAAGFNRDRMVDFG